jgi:hypothetical protein
MMPSAAGPPATFDFPVLDADGHVAEPHDLWARYCDARHRDAARAALHVADLPEGGSGLMLEGRCLVRGVEAVTFAGQNPRTFLGKKRWDEGYPGAFDPAHRLRDMDLEGIDTAMVFPSLAGALGGVRDPDLAAAMGRAYNRWILDYCATDPRRLLPAAVVPLQEPPAAVAEVEWAALQGFRCVMVRPCLYRGRAPDHPELAGFYAACARHELVVGLHPFPFADVEWSQAILPDLGGVASSRLVRRHDRAPVRQHAGDGLPHVRRRLRPPPHAQARVHGEQRHLGCVVDRPDGSPLPRGGHTLIRTPPARSSPGSASSRWRATSGRAAAHRDDREDVLFWASDFPHFDGHFPGRSRKRWRVSPRYRSG